MGFFSRKQESTESADPTMTELGREYAIAKRHGDRKTANRLTREVGGNGRTDEERAAFWKGADDYDAIPPAHSKRHNRRR
ncbi:hypothetical protein FCH28_37025 [Streptomyces piniterrae]|uniref:Uncharacterized protein n=1 Tax=Streptomyces piniterrae TaxID=2571125 RepID=A0A4U0MLD7_9ACTN|nr:hypothetical protein [Streptomyces piniterrae]TJZ41441.1 hypothetical protein FCH28_37025 [Streptomyces piniterrae]